MSLLLDAIVSLIEIVKDFIYDRRENLFDEHITVFYLTILKIKHYLSPVVKANINTDKSYW